MLEHLHLAAWFARRAWDHLWLDERGAPDQLDDLVQEMRLALFDAARTFDPDKGAFTTFAHWKMRGWLSRILHRWASLPMPPHDPDFFDNLPDDAPSADALAERAELRDAVADAMRFLSPREREAIQRRHFDGKMLDDVARDWGVTRERVRQIQIRAEAKLRKRLARYRETT